MYHMYIDIYYTCAYISLYNFTCILIDFACLYLKIKHIISLYFQLKFRQLSSNLISSILHLYLYLSLMSKVFVLSITNIISNYLNSKIHNSLKIKTPMLPKNHVLSLCFCFLIITLTVFGWIFLELFGIINVLNCAK